MNATSWAVIGKKMDDSAAIVYASRSTLFRPVRRPRVNTESLKRKSLTFWEMLVFASRIWEQDEKIDTTLIPVC